jgi:hypothetical protein
MIQMLLVFLTVVFAFKFLDRAEAYALCWIGGLLVAPVVTLVLTLPVGLLVYWIERRTVGTATWACSRIRKL